MRTGVIAMVVAAFLVTAPTASAVPTRDDADAFAEEVADQGILPNFTKDMYYQTLSLICGQASTPGISKGMIANLYMDNYGLSSKDAKWLVSTALDNCNN